LTNKILIIEADSKRWMKRFIRYPHQLYRNDPNYVPALNLMQEQILSKKTNPFFKTGDTACFLAINERNEIVGRIAAIYNPLHLDIYKDETGFFGFFDCLNDSKIAGQLLDKAASWLKEKGLKKMAGPENLTTNDSVGILTLGFNDPPCLLMPYNYPYYKDLLLFNDFKPLLKLFSYKADPATLPVMMHEKSEKLETRLQQHGIVFRLVDNKNFKKEMQALQKVYNEVNRENWGFIPLDDLTFTHMSEDLHKLVDEESVILAEKEGRLIGFIVTVPDYNQVFKDIPNGSLFPLGWLTLLRGRRHINRIRIIIMGVLPEWRGLGIDWCLYARVAEYVKRKNLAYGEACYVMENNSAMNKMMKALGGSIVKEYQLFMKIIQAD